MTEKIYDTNAYQISFTSDIISCKEAKDGRYSCILSHTAFFPEAGGQSGDRGILRDASKLSGDDPKDDPHAAVVLDTQIEDDGTIIHYIDRPLPEGCNVTGRIDWERRHSFMQHHSAEHIFSGLVKKHFGYDNAGFHLSDHICTMDYNGSLSAEDVAALEAECNRLIRKCNDIVTFYPPTDELDGYTYRCKGELVPPVRLVHIPEADLCACCAPHVRNTGEIGMMKITDISSHRGGVRLTLIAGGLAFLDYQRRFERLKDASRLLSTHPKELSGHLQKLLDERCELKVKIASLEAGLLKSKIDSLPDDENNIILFTGEADPRSIRNTINELTKKHSGYCGIFCKRDQGGYSFIIGSSDINLQQTAIVLRNELGAKCGGSPVMIQGSVDAAKAEILATLKKGIG